MGNINCSCFNNNEKDQIIFEKSDIIGQNTVFEQNKIFELISKYYDEKNILVMKISKEEFFEILYSDSYAKKILEAYDEIFNKDNFNINLNNNEAQPYKFIDNNAEKTFNDFYYFGEFNDKGIIDGKGIKIFNKNYIYKGIFSEEEYNGKGLLIKNEASIYGNWENGEIKGNVEYIINLKFNYKGNFENDLYNGEGQYIWGESGKKYVGQFKNGKIEGKGIFTYEDGTIFRGNFFDEYKNGEGCIEFPDGKKYFGNWLNDELYGNGYLLDGKKKIEVVFRHGKIISQKINNDIDNENTDNI